METQKAYAAENALPIQIEDAKRIIENVPASIPEISLNQEEPVSTVPDGYLSKPLIAETQVTVDPPKPIPAVAKPAVAPSTVTKAAVVKTAPVVTKVAARPAVGNVFPYGQCTYYVASRRPIYWRGNAGTWLSGARAAGFATGSTPKVGAIMVTAESPIGHVAYVEAVNGNQITVSEMNYAGFGVISKRTITLPYGLIKGFIY